jgi:putative endonuclease
LYILYSKKDNGLYVDCTSNLDERIERHNSGHVPATSSRRPLVCIWNEVHESKAEAFNRDRFLKTLWAARFKNKIKDDYLNRQSE